jgi:hypothetical protein
LLVFCDIHILTGNFDTAVSAFASSGLVVERSKGKAMHVNAWTGPEGFRRLRLPDFKTVGM